MGSIDLKMMLLMFLYPAAVTEERIVHAINGSDIVLKCLLDRSAALPEWKGPPNSTIYSKPGNTYLNEKVPSILEKRIHWNKNYIDLDIRAVQKVDEGTYLCNYGGNDADRMKLVVIDNFIYDCRALPNISYGTAHGNGTTTVGASAYVTCRAGYNASNGTITCQENGIWSLAICVPIVTSDNRLIGAIVAGVVPISLLIIGVVVCCIFRKRCFNTDCLRCSILIEQDHCEDMSVKKSVKKLSKSQNNNPECGLLLEDGQPTTVIILKKHGARSKTPRSMIPAKVNGSAPEMGPASDIEMEDMLEPANSQPFQRDTTPVTNPALSPPAEEKASPEPHNDIELHEKDDVQNIPNISEHPQNNKLSDNMKEEKSSNLPDQDERENNTGSNSMTFQNDSEDEANNSDSDVEGLFDGIDMADLLSGNMLQSNLKKLKDLQKKFKRTLRNGSDTESDEDSETSHNNEDLEFKKTLFKLVEIGDAEAIKSMFTNVPDKVKSLPALHFACSIGNLKSIEALLEMKADINAMDKVGNAPIHVAVIAGMDDALRHLLKCNADVNIQNKSSRTSLHIAVNNKKIACIRILLSYGASVNIKDNVGDTVMHDAIRKEDLTIIDEIFNIVNADFSIVNKKGFNVLNWAAFHGCTSAAKIIIRQKPELVNRQKRDFYTPLHVCATNDRKEIARALLEAKADPNIQDKAGRTPLHLAVHDRYSEMTKLLLLGRATVDTQDKEGNTALHLISRNIFQSHKSGKLKKNVMKQFRKTIIDHIKAEAEITCMLIKHGASLEVRNIDGLTPMDMCKDNVKSEFLQRLAKSPSSKDLFVTPNGYILPKHWEPAEHGRIGLDSNSQEFQNVQERLRVLLSKATRVNIERIQNTTRYETYTLEKKLLKHLERDVSQKTFKLYTSIDIGDVNEICDSNKSLLEILKGEEFKNIGKCIIFRSEKEYSDNQSTGNSHKLILQCQVLPGRLIKDDARLAKKRISICLGSTCCIVDNIDSPNVFRIFTSDQCYPKYVIEYE